MLFRTVTGRNGLRWVFEGNLDLNLITLKHFWVRKSFHPHLSLSHIQKKEEEKEDDEEEKDGGVGRIMMMMIMIMQLDIMIKIEWFAMFWFILSETHLGLCVKVSY